MAMGVVTLFGASEMTTGFEAPSSCAVTTAETTADRLRKQDGDQLFANDFQLLIEGDTEGDNGGFEPKLNL